MTSNSDIPDWIEAKLFENVLRETVENYKKILNFKADSAVAPGENYATTVLRLKIDVLLNDDSTQSHSFMLKVALDSEFIKEQLSIFDMFGIETGMYHDIIPEFKKLYADAGLKVQFVAKSYKLPTEEDYILLEDLSSRGFKNVKRQDCLDMEHSKAVLKKLAQWHAVSAVRVEQMGLYDQKYLKGLTQEDARDICKSMFDNTLKNVLPVVRKIKGHEEYYKHLEILSTKLTDVLFERNVLNLNEFNVLNHGDFWSNNIMFQYDSQGKIEEVYFVDFQAPGYGSPAQDLLYFILSSTKLDIKLDRFDFMIKYYHDNLVKNLALLKYSKPKPSLKDMHAQLLKYDIWGVLTATTTLIGVLCDPTEEASLENLISESDEGNQFREVLFSNDRIVKHLELVLPWLHNRGAFEI